jgi:predicted methyltransferase
MRNVLLCFCAAAIFGLVSACAPAPAPKIEEAGVAAPEPARGSLQWAIEGPWRTPLERTRDAARHPAETLAFFEIKPDASVLEIFPGRGWNTAILAPFLNAGGGRLIVASFDPASASAAQTQTLAAFDRRFEDEKLFGTITRAVLSPRSPPLVPPASVDRIILARNLHSLMGEGYAEKAFADFQAALKPGGYLCIEQHRANSTGLQDPQAASGYVQEAYVKLLAQEAGFVFVGSSEINANPRDDRDHPFGVWTLPPTLRTAPLGLPDDPKFDSGPYIAIGESDRMTLKFRKPEAAKAVNP